MKRYFVGPPTKFHKEFAKHNGMIGKFESENGKGLKFQVSLQKKLQSKRISTTKAKDLIVGSKFLADLTAWRCGELKMRIDWSELYTKALLRNIKFVPKEQRKVVWREIIKQHKQDKKYFRC
ncbi:MAG: hypothetical protein PHP82_02560 [Candidatus ainarchaeum sp.]|nr:hypothetical protein [Candidatus ainarchaeum sp.]